MRIMRTTRRQILATYSVLLSILTGTQSYASSAADVHGAQKIDGHLNQTEWKNDIQELRRMNLLVPIEHFNVEQVKGSYYQARGGQMHEASDFLAPRFTAVHAVSDGRIEKLFLSRFGGTTVYESEPSDRYIFYYAHLQSYAPGLKDGDKVRRGQIIGFVGTSGNAPPNTPHLHFSIGRMGPEKRWWKTAPLDPYEVFTKQSKI